MNVNESTSAKSEADSTAKSAKQIFNEALDLIREPSRWTRFDFARSANWRPVSPIAEKACRWCSIGALQKVNPASTYEPYPACEDVQEALSLAAVPYGLAGYNDHHSHAEVIALWEKVGREKGWLE